MDTSNDMRVKALDEDNYKKLKQVIKYLRATKDLVLTLEENDSGKIMWWVDSAFAVHNNMRSHTGRLMSPRKGAVCSASKKQKINTKS